MPALSKTSTVSSSSSSSSTPLVSKRKSFFSRLFSPPSSSSNPSTPSDPESILREILALNARHGHPEVQAYSVPSLYSTPSKKNAKSRSSSSSYTRAPPPPKYSARPPASPQETFDEIMRLNRRHGAPDVQALSVR